MARDIPLLDWARQSGLWRALRHRDYAVFSGASWISATGMWVQRVAIGVLTWQLTHSPAWLGAIALAQALPSMALVPFAGAIADRVDRVKLLGRTQLWSGVLGLVLTGLILGDAINIWLLAAFAFLLGLINTLGLPARITIAPTLVPRQDLSAAIAVNSVSFHSTTFIGPAIGALLIAGVGIGSAFLFNAITYLIMWAALFLVHPLREEHVARQTRLMADVLEGVKYALQHKGIAPVLFLLVLVSFFVRPLIDLLPGFVEPIFHHSTKEGVGALMSAFGVGGMTGSLWIANRGQLPGMMTICLAGTLAMAAATAAFALIPHFYVAIAVTVLIGIAASISQNGGQILIQSSVEGTMRARVMSLYTLNYRAAPALGALAIGWLAKPFGLQAPVAAAAILCLAWTLWVGRRRAALAEILEAGEAAPAE